MQRVQIRVAVRGKIEVIERMATGTDRESLEPVLNHVEGQIGTVLGVIGPNSERLYQSAIQPHEAGIS